MTYRPEDVEIWNALEAVLSELPALLETDEQGWSELVGMPEADLRRALEAVAQRIAERNE